MYLYISCRTPSIGYACVVAGAIQTAALRSEIHFEPSQAALALAPCVCDRAMLSSHIKMAIH
eukprot:scaffold19956_cov69-Phaeocystis_antarctica.AAC.1